MIMKRVLEKLTVCLVVGTILAGCGSNEMAENTGKTEENQIVEETVKEETLEKEYKNTELDVGEAVNSLKAMSDALSKFLYISMMSNSDKIPSRIEELELKLSEEEKIRASILASDSDGVIDSTFILDSGEIIEDKNSDSGPNGSGYIGWSVSKNNVEYNCLDLFGTVADWDALPNVPINRMYDAVKYKDETDTYALIIARDIETEAAFEIQDCSVSEKNGKYIGKVYLFWGYWGTLSKMPGYSNYIATFALEPRNDSKYGMIVTSINIKNIPDSAF